ncbi:MAG: hypothetical protein Q7J09_07150 [Methanocalculus sp.]|uniref:hypothetical protein n=1 Tax=Methanocalculus sp. TaxID=2004547 RepID=UPI00271B0D93|nr:hypothetical protein [Methanocalculus sp.]MDO8842449.1 hypothetical protein [Methanocalculus sp.]MDO9539760.1 hypothetical protein [Methanocalculus sp.]
MVALPEFILIFIVSLFFGLIVSFQITHIQYIRYLIKLARRTVMSGTLAPVLSELERHGGEI